MAQVVTDQRDPEMRYMPGHPDANKDGYVAYPRMNPAEDMVDLLSASAKISGQRGRDLRGERHDQTDARLVQIGFPINDRHEHSSDSAVSASALGPKDIGGAAPASRSQAVFFKDVLGSAINQVEGASNNANQSVQQISVRRRRRSAFDGSRRAARQISNSQMLMQVRNKVVSAYQEVMQDADVAAP